MTLGQLVRILAVAAACVVAGASASSTSNTTGAADPQYGSGGPPPAQAMDPARALGLWKSTFGAVKIEADNRDGGLQAGAVQGVWEYQRQGQDVIGLFWGKLQGNVLQFRWQEPASPPLTGEGYIVFDTEGRQYSGRWWSDSRDRVGDWNGWRQQGQQNPGQYGGQAYGSYPQQPQQPQQGYAPYPQQQYPQQQQQYPQQQYPQQQYPQQPVYPPPQQPQYPPQQQYPQPQPQYPPQQQPQYPPPAQYPQQGT